MKTTRIAARAAAALALAVGLTLGITGCTFITPIATLNQYNPSDGVNNSIGAVDLRNVVGIINDDGSTINLLITFVNNSDKNITVTVQYEGADGKVTQTVDVAAGRALPFGYGDEDDLLVVDSGVSAGALLPVYFQYGQEPGKQLMVPVLAPVQAEYEGLDRPSPTPTPTEIPVPAPAPEQPAAPDEGTTEG